MSVETQRIIVEVQDGGYVLDSEPVVMSLKLAEKYYPRELRGIIPQPPTPPEGDRPGEDAPPSHNVKDWELYDRMVAEHRRRIKELHDPVKIQRCHGRTAIVARGFYLVTGKDLNVRFVLLPGGDKAPDTDWNGPHATVQDAREAMAGRETQKVGQK